MSLVAAAAPGALARQAEPDAFRVEASASTPLSPRRAYAAFVSVGRWWDPAHTYSGVASNLSLTPRPGGCWCERLPNDGFVEHMRVLYAAPGEELRLAGGLGPLQTIGAPAVMVVRFEPEGAGTRVVLTYAVDGPPSPALAKLEAPVAHVLTEGMARFAAATRGRAPMNGPRP